MTRNETEAERLDRLARDRVERPLPKRFYKDVQVSDDNRILLDGRGVKTPLKAPLQLPNRRLADAVAAEWMAQVDVINPALMPLTKLSNTAIDRATAERQHVIDEIVQYANSDLVLYRASEPENLVALQAELWDPVLKWAANKHGMVFHPVSGITHRAQDAEALARLRAGISALDNWRLTAAYLLTTLTGSALLAVMLEQGAVTPETCWAAANLDEDFQVSQWGEDWEARLRREARGREFNGLVQFLGLLE